MWLSQLSPFKIPLFVDWSDLLVTFFWSQINLSDIRVEDVWSDRRHGSFDIVGQPFVGTTRGEQGMVCEECPAERGRGRQRGQEATGIWLAWLDCLRMFGDSCYFFSGSRMNLYEHVSSQYWIVFIDIASVVWFLCRGCWPEQRMFEVLECCDCPWPHVKLHRASPLRVLWQAPICYLCQRALGASAKRKKPRIRGKDHALQVV